ncbi:MAG: hypothetical protein HN411_00955 [Waddliaceae bacterium]|jgi:hypothetical protein|nr:hypothetical protein [Waddliaceae bacterium]MBT3579019.1 hypothetical protein [Waddliaceae bacterium]MBT4445132.1 hypothetical protein [Waddliaceae bacterium]MBT6929161.1 hypothetical protein [Waddliaceae bacterium]MBT7264233.1 hypothetical protein [Waddliaceae bacterium]
MNMAAVDATTSAKIPVWGPLDAFAKPATQDLAAPVGSPADTSSASSAINYGAHVTGNNSAAPLLLPPVPVHHNINIEELVNNAFKAYAEGREDATRYAKKEIEGGQKKKKELNKTRQNCLEELVKASKSNKVSSSFDKIATTVGYIVAATTSIITSGGLSAPVIVACLLGGALVVNDGLNGNEAIASVLEKLFEGKDGKGPTEESIESVLNTVSSLAIAGISLGLFSAGKVVSGVPGAAGKVVKAAKVGSGVVKGAAEISGGATKQKTGSLRAKKTREEGANDIIKDKMTLDTESLERAVTSLCEVFSDKRRLETAKNEAITAGWR